MCIRDRAESGHAKRALGIGIVFSFLGTIFSLIIMIVAAPQRALGMAALGHRVPVVTSGDGHSRARNVDQDVYKRQISSWPTLTVSS